MAEETTTPEVESTEEQEVTAPSLGVADLKLAAQVIEVVSQRGAIRPDEMEAVGKLYSTLMTFLIANGAVENPSAVTENTETTEEETTEETTDA